MVPTLTCDPSFTSQPPSLFATVFCYVLYMLSYPCSTEYLGVVQPSWNRTGIHQNGIQSLWRVSRCLCFLYLSWPLKARVLKREKGRSNVPINSPWFMADRSIGVVVLFLHKRNRIDWYRRGGGHSSVAAWRSAFSLVEGAMWCDVEEYLIDSVFVYLVAPLDLILLIHVYTWSLKSAA